MTTDIEALARMTVPQLQKYVWAILNAKCRNDRFEADEIISTAYILLWNKGLEFNFQNMKKQIYQAITTHIYNKNPNLTGELMNETEKACRRCSKLKNKSIVYPIAMFYKAKIYPNGLITYQPNCKNCSDELAAKRKALKDETTKQQSLQRAREKYAEKRKVINSNKTLLLHKRKVDAERAKKHRQITYYPGKYKKPTPA